MKETKPNARTRAAERAEAKRPPGPDRPPTEEEARRADEHELEESVIEHQEEMLERGARQRGEGRIP